MMTISNRRSSINSPLCQRYVFSAISCLHECLTWRMKTTHELWLFYIKMALFHEASDHETREETLTLFYDVVFQSTTKYIDSKFSKRQPLFCSNENVFLLRLLNSLCTRSDLTQLRLTVTQMWPRKRSMASMDSVLVKRATNFGDFYRDNDR